MNWKKVIKIDPLFLISHFPYQKLNIYLSVEQKKPVECTALIGRKNAWHLCLVESHALGSEYVMNTLPHVSPSPSKPQSFKERKFRCLCQYSSGSNDDDDDGYRAVGFFCDSVQNSIFGAFNCSKFLAPPGLTSSLS